MDSFDSTSLQTSAYKRIDDPWIGLLVASILIFVLSLIAILALCLCWRRYRQLTQISNESYLLSNRPTGKRQIPIQIEDQPPNTFETQKIDTFVPSYEDERLHARFPTPNDIQRVHQFYERTTQAYF